MKMMKKAFPIALAVLMGTAPAIAQKANVKGAERIADKKGDYKEARTLIKAALENDETKSDPKTWYVAGFVEESNFTLENNKQLKGETPDRAVMNAALLDMFDYYVATVKMESPDGVKLGKYSKKIKDAFQINLLYFINAGGYYMEQKNYTKALEAFDNFKQIKKMPMFAGTPFAAADSNSMMVDFFSVINAYQTGDKKLTVKLAEEIKSVDYRRNDLYQILSQTYLEMADTVNYVATMKEGLSLYPNESYFSVNLINTLIQTGKSEEAIALLQKSIEKAPNNAQLYDVMGKLYEPTDEAKALQCFAKALEIDPSFTESNFNMGRVYYNQAVAIKSGDKVDAATDKKAEELFRKALPYLEKAYAGDPDTAYYVLSTVYYNLKMSKEYEAIKAKYNL
ncbi:Tetratricopeptide repeat-containing protein [Porphyromonas circumdentaria]|uniref:Tetratricopeptide repeat-containing protein n=2 Tax=Porphyromonas circumdentaria TaxID=29524 RepID=A0A1T4P677_9PORP|nr:Tetratricopeptide repeat-containing protein [Porphyromonas circumdentaria]